MKNKTDFGTFSRLFRTILEHRYLPAILCVAAFAISLPAVTTGWEPSDDLRHRAKLIDPSHLPDRYAETGLVPDNSGKLSTILRDLHTAARTNKDIQKLKDYGTLPWWTNDTLRHSNWRPVDSFTHWLDYRLFPNSAAMIHLHSIAWLAAVVLLVAVLYRRFIGPCWVAGFAAMLYLLDDSNYYPTMWIANRNLLISLVFGILTLLSHHKWRTDNSMRAAIIAPFCLVLSLLATEAGIATFAYLLTYALVLDGASRVRRLLSIVPYLLLIVLWRIIYNGLGHGANEIAVFADPGREPFHYLQLVIERLPPLLMGQWGFLSAEIFLLVSDSAKTVVWLVSLVFVSIVFLTFLPFLRKDRIARFWFLGMILSVPPICATLPMNRNLLFVAIGSFALMAQFVSYVRRPVCPVYISRVLKIMAYVICVTLLFIHIPISLTTRAAAPKAVTFLHDNIKRTVSIGAESELENQDVIIINAPNPFMCFFIPSIRAHNGEPLPRSMRILAPGFNSVEVIRTGARNLLLRAQKGNIFTCQQKSSLHLVYMFNQASGALRDDSSLLRPGMRIELPRFMAEVVSVDQEGLPTKVLFEFAVSLDDSSLKWLQWDWNEYYYKPFKPPTIGEHCVLNGPFD